jgi:hypothetical protein
MAFPQSFTDYSSSQSPAIVLAVVLAGKLVAFGVKPRAPRSLAVVRHEPPKPS